MVNLVRVIGTLFFLATMGWGAYATLYGEQMSGRGFPNMPILESPELSNSTMLMLGFVPVALVILQIYAKVASGLGKSRPPISNINSDLPDDKPGLSHLDENYMEKYAANFRSEQAAQANLANASSPHQSPATWPSGTASSTGFGRRK